MHQHHRFGADQSAAGDLPVRIHGKRTARPIPVCLSERPEDFGLEARRRHHCPAGSGRTMAGGAGQNREPPVSDGGCAEYGRRRGGVFLQLVQRHHRGGKRHRRRCGGGEPQDETQRQCRPALAGVPSVEMGDGAVAGEIRPAGQHLQTGGCIRYAGTPGHRRTAQPRSGHSGLLSDRPDTTPDTPADDTAESSIATAH